MATSEKTKPKMSGLGSKKETKPKAVKAKSKAATKAPKDLLKASSHEVENLTQAKAIKLAPELIDSNGMNDFKLGGVLLKIQEEKWWDDGAETHESFKDYIESGLGMAYRKCMYLVNIYEKLVEEGISWSSVKPIGWSKLRFIINHITKDTVDEWVKRAAEMNSLEIQSYVKALEEKGTTSNNDKDVTPTKVSTMTFKVHPDQKAIITEAIESQMEETGTEFPSVALEHMAIAIVEGKLGKPKAAKVTKKSVTDFLKKMGQEDAADLIVGIYPDLGAEED